jgi:hypothetical protein
MISTLTVKVATQEQVGADCINDRKIPAANAMIINAFSQ